MHVLSEEGQRLTVPNLKTEYGQAKPMDVDVDVTTVSMDALGESDRISHLGLHRFSLISIVSQLSFIYFFLRRTISRHNYEVASASYHKVASKRVETLVVLVTLTGARARHGMTVEEGKKIVRRRSCSFGRNVEELQNGKLVGFSLPYFVRFPVLAFRFFFFFLRKS